MRAILLFLSVLFLSCFCVASELNPIDEKILAQSKKLSQESMKWAVYYGNEAAISEFEPYSLIVLDANNFKKNGLLKYQKKQVIGYLSMGEIRRDSPYYAVAKTKNVVLAENRLWKGSFFADLRKKDWQQMILNDLLPTILVHKFDGIFIDALDSPLSLEKTNPKKYKGMKKHAIRIIKTIRRHHPNIYIMVNRAFDILPDIAHHIDGVLAESIFTNYDIKKKTYGMADTDRYEREKSILVAAKSAAPGLTIFSLDYWDPADKRTIKKIYDTQRKNGFVPYVSTVSLNRVIPEPKI